MFSSLRCEDTVKPLRQKKIVQRTEKIVVRRSAVNPQLNFESVLRKDENVASAKYIYGNPVL